MTAEGMMVEDADDGWRKGMMAWGQFPRPGVDHVPPEEWANNLKRSGWDAVQIQQALALQLHLPVMRS